MLIRLCVTKHLWVVYSLVNFPQGVATNFDRHRASELGFHSDRVRPFDLSKDRTWMQRCSLEGSNPGSSLDTQRPFHARAGSLSDRDIEGNTLFTVEFACFGG